MGRDPALRIGTHGLPLGVPRKPQALAGRRPADLARGDAAVTCVLLRGNRSQSRFDRRRLWPSGSGAAACARYSHASSEQPDGRNISARFARIHRRIHRREQPPGHAGDRAISHVRMPSGLASAASVASSLMRIRISHATTYAYDQPPKGVTQVLRLSPRDHDGQHVIMWRSDLSEDCLLHQHEDAFGNIIHSFTAEGPFEKLSVEVNGEVDTQDTNGRVEGAVERFPPQLFLRETSLTHADHTITQFATAIRADTRGDNLALLHALLKGLNREIAFDTDPTHTATTAAEAFALRRGVCQDITHIFVAAARSLGIPARYVGGHFHRVDGVTSQEAGHAWAEAFIENLGWVGFDPTNGISTTDAHVRVAVGLDYLGAAPVRGTRYGGAGETLTVAVRVAQARQQIQN